MIPLIAPLTPLTLALLWAPPEPPAPTAPVAAPVAEDPQEPADATAEDVEVMRRLLVRAVREALGGGEDGLSYSFRYEDDPAAAPPPTVDGDVAEFAVRQNLVQRYAVGFLGSADGSVDHSRGFHVPGTGVVYALDVTVPVRPAQAAQAGEGAAEEDAADDAWEAAERAVRGGPGETGSSYLRVQTIYQNSLGLDPITGVPGRAHLELDGEALDAVVDAALATVARHGRRIEGLGARDTITVAMHVTGSHLRYPAKSFASTEGESVHGATDLAWTYLGLAAGQKLEARVVVQLAVADLEAAAGIAGKPGELRARALVHRY